MGLTGSPETSVSNHLTPRNNPEEERINEFNTRRQQKSKRGHFLTCLQEVLFKK
jgi:hypothetical protein